MALRVTFDTNTIDKAVRPQLSPKDPCLPEFRKINAALSRQAIDGVFSETIITIEGIKRADRAVVFGSTRLHHSRKESSATEDGTTMIPLELLVEQPARSPLDVTFTARVEAAVKLGLRMLRAPRIGALPIKDPDKTLYVQDADANTKARRQEGYHNVLRAIQSRGLGFSRLRKMADAWAKHAGTIEPWYQSIGHAKNIQEQRAIERAFAEWSDGDSIAAHISYGMELFCTEDKGKSGDDPSVFDEENRSWLEQTYKVKFVSLPDLAAML